MSKNDSCILFFFVCYSFPLSDTEYNDQDLKDESNLTGILQLKSLDPPGSPTETDTDTLSGQASEESRSSSKYFDEAMDLDNPDEELDDHMSNTRITVFQDKSFEELRAESLAEACNIQRIQGDGDGPVQSCVDISDNTNLSASSLAENTICDTGASSEVSGDNLDISAKEIGEDNTCNNQSSVHTNHAGDSIMSSGKESGDGSFSDSDSVFMDNLSGTDSHVTGGNPPEKVHVHVDNTFNNFQYWRSPLPEVNIDFDLINGKPTNIHVVAKVKDDDSKKVYASEMNVSISSNFSDGTSALSDSLSQIDLGTSSSLICSNISSEEDRTGVRIHTASVSTVSDAADEMVSNIGSTHVLGQHFGEQHLAVVDGVVQGTEIVIYLSFNFLLCFFVSP